MTHRLYVLIDPRDEAVRYIGVTKRPLEARLQSHLADASRQREKSHRGNWIRSLRGAGLKPCIVLLRELGPGEDWRVAEMAAIADAKATGARLVNGTLGGEGVTGRVYVTSAATRAKLAVAGTGRRASKETRQRRSESLRRVYADPVRLARRQELARAAARSDAGRLAASTRMKEIWSDPARAAAMREAMRGKKKGARLQCR